MRFTKLALTLLLATSAWSAAVPASAAPRPLPPLTPAKHDALSRALEQGRLTESQYALERAKSLFTLGRVRAEFGDVARAKPEPDLFIECARRLDADPADCYVIGDAVWDLLAARRARMLSIGLLSGGYGADELQGAGAFRVYRDAAELHSSLDELGI